MTSIGNRRVPQLSAEQRNRLAQRLAMTSRNRADTGGLLPLTAAALAVPADSDFGAARLEAVVSALRSERVIVPIDVEPDPREAGVHAGPSGDGHVGVDFVHVETPAGTALAAYSSADELRAHRPQDRPRSMDFRTLGLSALVEAGGRILLDPAGAAVLLPRPAVAALSQGDRWLPAWKDQELLDELRSLAGVGAVVVDVRIRYVGDALFRVEVAADASGDPRAVRAELGSVMQAIGSSKRLIASADRVELVPVRA